MLTMADWWLHPPPAGAVLIDGQNIADVTQASLRADIGVVPQDTVRWSVLVGGRFPKSLGARLQRL